MKLRIFFITLLSTIQIQSKALIINRFYDYLKPGETEIREHWDMKKKENGEYKIGDLVKFTVRGDVYDKSKNQILSAGSEGYFTIMEVKKNKASGNYYYEKYYYTYDLNNIGTILDINGNQRKVKSIIVNGYRSNYNPNHLKINPQNIKKIPKNILRDVIFTPLIPIIWLGEGMSGGGSMLGISLLD